MPSSNTYGPNDTISPESVSVGVAVCIAYLGLVIVEWLLLRGNVAGVYDAFFKYPLPLPRVIRGERQSKNKARKKKRPKQTPGDQPSTTDGANDIPAQEQGSTLAVPASSGTGLRAAVTAQPLSAWSSPSDSPQPALVTLTSPDQTAQVHGAAVAHTATRVARSATTVTALSAAFSLSDVVSLISLWVRFIQIVSFSFIDDIRPAEDVYRAFAEFYDGIQSVVHGFQGLFPYEETSFWVTWALSFSSLLVFFVAGALYNFATWGRVLRRPVLKFNWILLSTLLMPVIQVCLSTAVCVRRGPNGSDYRSITTHDFQSAYPCWGNVQLITSTLSFILLLVFIPLASVSAPLIPLITEVNDGNVYVKPLFSFILVQGDIILAIVATFFAPLSPLNSVIAALLVSAVSLAFHLYLVPVAVPFIHFWRTVSSVLQLWTAGCALLAYGLDSGSAVPLSLILAGWASAILTLVIYHQVFKPSFAQLATTDAAAKQTEMADISASGPGDGTQPPLQPKATQPVQRTSVDENVSARAEAESVDAPPHVFVALSLMSDSAFPLSDELGAEDPSESTPTPAIALDQPVASQNQAPRVFRMLSERDRAPALPPLPQAAPALRTQPSEPVGNRNLAVPSARPLATVADADAPAAPIAPLQQGPDVFRMLSQADSVSDRDGGDASDGDTNPARPRVFTMLSESEFDGDRSDPGSGGESPSGSDAGSDS